MKRRTTVLLAAAGLALGLLCGSASSGAGLAKDGAVVGMRRLTEAQYRNAIADVFGPHIRVSGRFEPIVRPEQGLFATGASDSSVSPAGFEQYDVMARGIAAQVLDPQHRATFMPCEPRDARKADAACAAAFYGGVGRYLLRRPLTPRELKLYVALAEPRAGGDFFAGLELGLAAMLVSPEFLFRMETAHGREMDAYARASRLSFLLWNSIPDEALLAAAGRGELERPAGLAAQVDRMLASPRLEQGARAFFTDFLLLDKAPEVAKDPVVYERFNRQTAQDLPEQLLRTVVDHLLTRDRPYPELFTTRRTFLTRRLGVLYEAPAPRREGWQPYEFEPGDGRAGLLGMGAFLAVFSHEGRSSPTLRGKAIREVLMCQPVPMPPPNVDFSGFNDTSNAVLKTARQRLERHNTDPVCAACHKITDPLGLPLERFDGVGGLREQENGAAIDVSGVFEGQAFEGADGLGALLARSPATGACLAQRVAEYATGLETQKLPAGWSDGLARRFAETGHRYRALLRQVALSPELYTVRPGTPERQARYAPASKEVR